MQPNLRFKMKLFLVIYTLHITQFTTIYDFYFSIPGVGRPRLDSVNSGRQFDGGRGGAPRRGRGRGQEYQLQDLSQRSQTPQTNVECNYQPNMF